MAVEPIVGLGDQLTVETLLASPRLVTAAQDDSLPLRVESERNRQTPFAASKRSSFMFL